MLEEQEQGSISKEPPSDESSSHEDDKDDNKRKDNDVELLNLVLQCSKYVKCNEGICWRLDVNRLVSWLGQAHSTSAEVPRSRSTSSLVGVGGVYTAAVVLFFFGLLYNGSLIVRSLFAILSLCLGVFGWWGWHSSEVKTKEEEQIMAAKRVTLCPGAWQMIPMLRCMVEVAKDDITPDELVLNSMNQYRVLCNSRCVERAKEALKEHRLEDALLWFVLSDDLQSAQDAAREYKLFDVAMVLVENVTVVREYMNQQTKLWKAEHTENVHKSLFSALALLAGDGPDAHLFSVVRSFINSEKNEEDRAVLAGSFALQLSHIYCDKHGEIPFDEMLLRICNMLENELQCDHHEVVPGLEYVLLRLLKHGGDKRDLDCLKQHVGIAAGWMFVQCLNSLCPLAFRRDVIHATGTELAGSCSWWSLGVYVYLIACGPGLQQPLDERKAMELFLKNRKEGDDVNTKVCEEVLRVPKDRWCAIEYAEEDTDDWDRIESLKHAQSLVLIADRLKKVAQNKVYRREDIQSLYNLLGDVLKQYPGIVENDGKLYSIYLYSDLFLHPDKPDEADILEKLCSSMGKWNSSKDVNRQAEYRARVHISVFTAQHLQRWSILHPEQQPSLFSDFYLSNLTLDSDMEKEIHRYPYPQQR